MTGPMPKALLKFIVLLALVLSCTIVAAADTASEIDALMKEAGKHLYSEPQRSVVLLEQLKERQPAFTTSQNENYLVLYASSLGFRGKHEARVELLKPYFGSVKSPATRARFLYELIDGNTALGKYEDALQAMNEAILLLPLLEKLGSKLTVLKSAITLLTSLRAYDEALVFVERTYALDPHTPGSYVKCVALTDKVEINFLRGNSPVARGMAPAALQACEANKNALFTLIVETHLAIDLIDSGFYAKGISASLPLLDRYAVLSNNSDYVTQLEEATARAYLQTGKLDRAEHYGLRAHQRALSGMALQLQERTSETMAAIKRAQDQFIPAIAYYDANLALKKKILDDRLHQNLAYQRVKFDAQDKANQMDLLEQKNRILNAETELQKGRYQIMVLLMTLGLVALVILGAWLIKTLKQRSVFRQSAQVDGLTQISNRAYFTVCGQLAFGDAHGTVSLILFDMDLFKRINDSYGHPAGDWVLKTVCETVKSQLRRADFFGRLGGEEFALCLPSTGKEEALALAERCRAAIAAIDTAPSGFTFPLSASFGIATRSAHTVLTFEEALAAADKALYLSKTGGRNRVSVYRIPGPIESL